MQFNLSCLAQPQSQLPGWAGVVLDEVADVLGDRLACDVAPFLNLFGDLSRDFAGPMLASVEGHHANRRIELASQQIANHGLKVRAFDIGLAVGGAPRTEAFQHGIDRFKIAVRRGLRRPTQTLLLLGAFLWDGKDNYKGNEAVDDCIHGPKNDQRQDVGTVWPH